MNEEVELGEEGALHRLVDQLGESSGSLSIGEVEKKSLLDVLHGTLVHPRDPARGHHGEEGEEEVAGGAEDVERLAAHVHELVETLGHRLAAVDDEHHVGGEDKGNAVPAESSKLLSIPQEFAKVDVEKVARGLDHDVVVVPVPDSHDVGDHAVAGARLREVVDRRVELEGALVVLLQPGVEDASLEGAGDSGCDCLDLSQGFRVLDKLNHPGFPPSRDTLRENL